jgi:hypothetical protein
LLFEPGTFNSTVWVFDDLMGPEFINPCSGVTPDNSIIDDFECQRHLSYTFSNGTLANVANPSTGGLNASTSCGKFTKYAPPTSDGAFGGSLNNAFTNTTYNRLKVHLYDPASPQNFHVILQDAANQDLIDTIFTTTGSSAWTEYVMDLSPLAPTASVEKIVFLLNPATTTIDSIFFDNVTLAFDSLVSSVATPLEKSWTKIAPVPFQDYFEVFGEEPIQSVMLHDFTGKLLGMVEQSTGNTLRVETAALPAGVYFATVNGLDGKQSVHKLVKY